MTMPILSRSLAMIGRLIAAIWTNDGGRSVQIRVGSRRQPAIRRASLVAVAAFATTAAAPPIPASLASYVHDGQFEPGDYGWMRGAFADATPAQRADWQAVEAWRSQCLVEEHAAVREVLKQRGVAAAGANLGTGEGVCSDVAYAGLHGDQGKSWAAFQLTVARASPIANAVIWSAALAQQFASPHTPDTAAGLIARPMTDQLLRGALNWDKGEVTGAPPLDPAALDVAQGLIWLAIARRDHANTAWMKEVVAREGFPTIARVGKDASHMAWLLVQHADDDPVFQLDMLRLMEPLAARGQVAKKDYAYLYDRVMLKVAGRQRYASQFTCAGGRRTPLPLEEAAGVDARRRDMGMDTVAEYTAEMEKAYGPCPPDVIPPSPAKR